MKQILTQGNAKQILEGLISHSCPKKMKRYLEQQYIPYQQDDYRFFTTLLESAYEEDLASDAMVEKGTSPIYCNDYTSLSTKEDKLRYMFFLLDKSQGDLMKQRVSEKSINKLPALLVQYGQLAGASLLRKRLYAYDKIQILEDINLICSDNFYKLERFCADVDRVTRGIMIHLYFSKDLVYTINELSTLLASERVFSTFIHGGSTRRVHFINDETQFYKITSCNSRSLFKNGFARAYTTNSQKGRDFTGFKAIELNKWERFRQNLPLDSWEYLIASAYIKQVKRYTLANIKPFITSPPAISSEIDPSKLKEFFSMINKSSELQSMGGFLHPESTVDELVAAFANDSLECKPVYFTCKKNVMAYLIFQIASGNCTLSWMASRFDRSNKLMFIPNLKKPDKTPPPLNKLKSITRQDVYGGNRSFMEKCKDPESYERDVKHIIEPLKQKYGF